MIMHTTKPCKMWQEHLAARHPQDISVSEHAALNAHLAQCKACTATYADYHELTAKIQALALPNAQVSLSLPELIQQSEEHSMKNAPFHLVPLPSEHMPSLATSNRSRMMRWLNPIAAILFVGLLIGSSLILFTHHSSSNGADGGQAASPHYTPLVHPPTRSCISDPGLYKICMDGLYIQVHLVKTLPSGYTITIERLYADASQGVVGYTLRDSHNRLPYLPKYSLIATYTANGHELPSGIGGGFYGVGTQFPDGPNPGGLASGMQYIGFNTSTITGNPKDLFLHMKATLLYFPPLPPNTTSQASTNLGQVSFDFSMPFHAEHHIVNMSQTITTHGMSLTLKRIDIALTRTQVDLICDQATLDKLRQLQVTTHLVAGKTQADGRGVSLSTTDISAFFLYPLYNERGAWTLKIPFMGYIKGVPINSSWTFRFIIPS